LGKGFLSGDKRERGYTNRVLGGKREVLPSTYFKRKLPQKTPLLVEEGLLHETRAKVQDLGKPSEVAGGVLRGDQIRINKQKVPWGKGENSTE